MRPQGLTPNSSPEKGGQHALVLLSSSSSPLPLTTQRMARLRSVGEIARREIERYLEGSRGSRWGLRADTPSLPWRPLSLRPHVDKVPHKYRDTESSLTLLAPRPHVPHHSDTPRGEVHTQSYKLSHIKVGGEKGREWERRKKGKGAASGLSVSEWSPFSKPAESCCDSGHLPCGSGSLPSLTQPLSPWP